MSDARVKKAILDSISKQEECILKNINLQFTVTEMMLQAGNTGHALWSLTNRYKEYDRQIGEYRASIRNLRENLKEHL